MNSKGTDTTGIGHPRYQQLQNVWKTLTQIILNRLIIRSYVPIHFKNEITQWEGDNNEFGDLRGGLLKPKIKRIGTSRKFLATIQSKTKVAGLLLMLSFSGLRESKSLPSLTKSIYSFAIISSLWRSSSPTF